jgi:hypothetical protein
VARVAAVFGDLLLGSNVLGTLRAAGHEAELTVRPDPGAFDVLVVDLTATTFDPVATAAPHIAAGTRTLGLFSHVHPEQRDRALAAGFDVVVPRSRFAREGTQLVERLLGVP